MNGKLAEYFDVCIKSLESYGKRKCGIPLGVQQRLADNLAAASELRSIKNTIYANLIGLLKSALYSVEPKDMKPARRNEILYAMRDARMKTAITTDDIKRYTDYLTSHGFDVSSTPNSTFKFSKDFLRITPYSDSLKASAK